MKLDITSLDGAANGSIELSDEVFGLEPRADLIARMVNWQLAKRRAGSAKTHEPSLAAVGGRCSHRRSTSAARDWRRASSACSDPGG